MIERSMAFGQDNGLIGTVTLAEHGEGTPAGVGFVTFNAGVVHRVGPHRINVRLARRLAARGIPSIRFDLSGQGDSARATCALGFEARAIADLGAAMERLGAESGVKRFVLFGFCSGGCHSYAAAQQDDRIAGILLYDTYIFPTPQSSLNRYWLKVRHRGLLRSLGRGLWRLASGSRVDVRDTAAPAVALDLKTFRTPEPGEFAAVVKRLHDRGTRVCMIYSGSFEDYNYRNQFRDRFRSFGIDGIVTSDFLPGMGHTATLMSMQAELMCLIEKRVVEIDQLSKPALHSSRA